MSDIEELRKALRQARAARALIAKPEQYVKTQLAADERGADRDPWAVDACKFCAVGAAARGILPRWDQRHSINAYEIVSASDLGKVMAGIAIGIYGNSRRAKHDPLTESELDSAEVPIYRVNDALGHEAVLEMFDTSIAYLEGAISAAFSAS